MVNSDDAYRVLTHAVEDCTGLWDAVWELCAARDWSEDESKSLLEYESKIPIAKSILLSMSQFGWIEFYRGTSWLPSANTETVVRPEDIESIFSDISYWQIPDGGEYICFYATPKGRQKRLQGKQSLTEFDSM